MALLPIDQLIKPVTKEEAKQSLYDILDATGLPTSSWQQGAVVRTIIAIVAALFSGLTVVVSTAVRGTILELAEGIWLTYLALFVFNVQRIEATFGTGEATLTNTGGGVFEDVKPGECILKNTSTGKTYVNVEEFTLLANETLTIAIRAVEAGSASSAAPGDIDDMVTKFLGVTVSNDATVSGTDEELDPALRVRCRDALGALSPFGPQNAYLYFAKSAKRADGTSIGVTRASASKSSSTGDVLVVVATALGAVSGDAEDPDTDLGAVNDAIQRWAAPLGVTATVESAVEHPLVFDYELWIYDDAGVDAEALADAALAAYVAALPIGGNVIPPADGKVSWRALVGAIEKISPRVIEAEIDPETDETLDPNEVAVLSLGTRTIHEVEAP